MYLFFLYLPFTRHYPVSLPLQIPLLVFCSPPQHLLDEEPAGLSTLVALSLVLTWCWLWNDFQRNLGQQLKIWDGSFPSSLLLSKDILLAAPCSQIIRSCWGSFFLQAQLLVLALSSATDRASPWTSGLDRVRGIYFFTEMLNMEPFRSSSPACREGPRGQDLCLTKPAMWHVCCSTHRLCFLDGFHGNEWIGEG